MDCMSDEMPDTVNGQCHMLRTLVWCSYRCSIALSSVL